MKRDENGQRKEPDDGIGIDRELSTHHSYLWGCVRAGSTSGVFALYLRVKQGGIWVAVAKRANNANGLTEVAFGQGRSVGSALKHLGVSMQQGKWKRDLPFVGTAKQ